MNTKRMVEGNSFPLEAHFERSIASTILLEESYKKYMGSGIIAKNNITDSIKGEYTLMGRKHKQGGWG